jgi:hypothetical protein
MSRTIACQFVFEPGEYDDEFHLLDGQIDNFASELSGFISVHCWVSPDGRLKKFKSDFIKPAAASQLTHCCFQISH